MNTENNIHIIPSQEYACLLAHLPLGNSLPVSTNPSENNHEVEK